jgi:hypothetical protein
VKDPLFFPNLFNVASSYEHECGLCLNLGTNLAPLSWEDKVREIRKRLWGAGFNQSIEATDSLSCWSTMRRIDPRVANLGTWEEETKKDPFFPLTVPWQPGGKTVGEVMEEMLAALVPASLPASAAELAAILNLCLPKPGRRRTGLFSLRG